jgi:hypothetical protein
MIRESGELIYFFWNRNCDVGVAERSDTKRSTKVRARIPHFAAFFQE